MLSFLSGDTCFFSVITSACLWLMQVNSEHPLAKAIVEYSRKIEGDRLTREDQQQYEVLNFESIAGHGVRCRVGGKKVLIGNPKLMKDSGIEMSDEAKLHLEETETVARTGVLVAIEEELVGEIAISDPVKPEAASVINILKSMGVQSMMVTGDNWGTAYAIAGEVGIEKHYVKAEVLPEDKARIVKELQVSYVPICFFFSFFQELFRQDGHQSWFLLKLEPI